MCFFLLFLQLFVFFGLIKNVVEAFPNADSAGNGKGVTFDCNNHQQSINRGKHYESLLRKTFLKKGSVSVLAGAS